MPSIQVSKRTGACPLCGKQGETWNDKGSDVHFSCRRCGDFRMTLEFYQDFRDLKFTRDVQAWISAVNPPSA